MGTTSTTSSPSSAAGGTPESSAGGTGSVNWQAKAIAAMRRDPKRNGFLAVLAMLLVVTLVRQFAGNKPRAASASPSRATAASPTATSAQPANSRISDPDAAHNLKRPTSNSPALQKWADSAPAPISRNLFAVRMEYFPVDGLRIPGNGAAGGDDGFWARLEKSLTVQADQRGKRENQIANYKARAAELNLQSTMMGPTPKAMVNGELVGEGDVVASFRVSRIEARRIIVEREGIRLEIQMK
jgi:hypothetical protein